MEKVFFFQILFLYLTGKERETEQVHEQEEGTREGEKQSPH